MRIGGGGGSQLETYRHFLGLVLFFFFFIHLYRLSLFFSPVPPLFISKLSLPVLFQRILDSFPYVLVLLPCVYPSNPFDRLPTDNRTHNDIGQLRPPCSCNMVIFESSSFFLQ